MVFQVNRAGSCPVEKLVLLASTGLRKNRCVSSGFYLVGEVGISLLARLRLTALSGTFGFPNNPPRHVREILSLTIPLFESHSPSPIAPTNIGATGDGGRGGTRTHTILRPLAPEASASTNSATRPNLAIMV